MQPLPFPLEYERVVTSGTMNRSKRLSETNSAGFSFGGVANSWALIVSFLVFVLTQCLFVARTLHADVNEGVPHAYKTLIRPREAYCLRARRRADYTTVVLFIGAERIRVELLLDLSTVVENATEAAIIHQSSVATSSSLKCSDDSSGVGFHCEDIALLQKGRPIGKNTDVKVRFQYSSAGSQSTSMSQLLGLSGSIRLARGTTAVLTPSSLCLQPFRSEDEGILGGGARVTFTSSNLVRTTRAELQAATAPLDSTPAAVCPGDDEAVELFPTFASNDAAWTGIKTLATSSEAVERRRVLIERGHGQCNGEFTSTDEFTFALDCSSSYAGCQRNASMPFRRVADTSFAIALGAASGVVHTTLDSRLNALDQNLSLTVALLKLVVLLLSSALVWSRRTRTFASLNAFASHCVTKAQTGDVDFQQKFLENIFVGVLGVCIRVFAVAFRFDGLLHDGQQTLLVLECAACATSVASLFLRYQGDRDPLLAFGGSTTVLDATSSIYLLYASPPLFASTQGNFDASARLLITVIALSSSLHRSLISAWCAAYKEQNLFVLAAWLIQIVTLAAEVTSTFALPFIFSLFRNYALDLFGLESLAIVLMLTALFSPPLLFVLLNVTQAQT